MREKENFRPILEQILISTNGKQWLCVKDVMNFLGISRNTVNKRYPKIKKDKGCYAVDLARIISNN